MEPVRPRAPTPAGPGPGGRPPGAPEGAGGAPPPTAGPGGGAPPPATPLARDAALQEMEEATKASEAKVRRLDLAPDTMRIIDELSEAMATLRELYHREMSKRGGCKRRKRRGP